LPGGQNSTNILFYYTAFTGREQEENGLEKPPLPKGGFKTQPPHARVCMGRLAYFRTILVLLFLHVGSHTQAQQGGDGGTIGISSLVCGMVLAVAAAVLAEEAVGA